MGVVRCGMEGGSGWIVMADGWLPGGMGSTGNGWVVVGVDMQGSGEGWVAVGGDE